MVPPPTLAYRPSYIEKMVQLNNIRVRKQQQQQQQQRQQQQQQSSKMRNVITQGLRKVTFSEMRLMFKLSVSVPRLRE